MKNTVLLGIICLLTACNLNGQWGKRIKGNGNQVTEERQVGSYDAVSVSHIFTVYLVAGSEGQLRVEAEENLMEHIITEVSGNELKIHVERGIQLEPGREFRKDGIRIWVPVESISEVSASGASDLIGEVALTADRFKASISGAADCELDVTAETVLVDMSGASELRLSGAAETLEIEGSGASDLDAYGLTARHVDAELSGSSDADVTANESLRARVSGAGGLTYRGNPDKLESKASGAGSVRKG
ncbi:head GIN domain-containing protein [Robiginitalea sp. SC105]|uniref:head GIN domain-containing protein n=1 Tax=Robiginitalea sp. SC105 TaxID=2762332 RepID=UPI001639D9E5|nr:head GIN domain-containing protein [Robiginitalea sp. SC105]MBC2840196.1 DUF2807 domain-containing protein [Robiginitalea sp. SC105]